MLGHDCNFDIHPKKNRPATNVSLTRRNTLPLAWGKLLKRHLVHDPPSTILAPHLLGKDPHACFPPKIVSLAGNLCVCHGLYVPLSCHVMPRMHHMAFWDTKPQVHCSLQLESYYQDKKHKHSKDVVIHCRHQTGTSLSRGQVAVSLSREWSSYVDSGLHMSTAPLTH